MSSSDSMSHEAPAPQRPTPTKGFSLFPASSDSRAAAQALANDVPLRRGIPVRKAFVRDEAAQPPLSLLYRGGRSGVVAVRLYLALIWKSSAAPYDTAVPARGWATLLDLPDPGGLGQRRVTRALAALEEHNLVAITRPPGRTPNVRLLDESGNGEPYVPPSYIQTPDGTGFTHHRYFKVPVALWRFGFLQSMSGPALIVLLILLAEQADDPAKPVWFSGTNFDDRYKISHKTRTEGVKELTKLGFLQVGRQPVNPRSDAMAVFAAQRSRHTYTLVWLAADQGLRAAPTKAPGTTPARLRSRRPQSRP